MKAITTISSLLLLMLSSMAHSSWPDVDIDLTTCQPDGPIGKMSQAWDPLKFWVKQNVSLEMALEQEDLNGLMENCRINYSDNKTDLLECYQRYKNRHQSIVKCLKHTTKLCRHHGGRC